MIIYSGNRNLLNNFYGSPIIPQACFGQTDHALQIHCAEDKLPATMQGFAWGPNKFELNKQQNLNTEKISPEILTKLLIAKHIPCVQCPLKTAGHCGQLVFTNNEFNNNQFIQDNLLKLLSLVIVPVPAPTIPKLVFNPITNQIPTTSAFSPNLGWAD
jgi:hypothetical protein